VAESGGENPVLVLSEIRAAAETSVGEWSDRQAPACSRRTCERGNQTATISAGR